MPSVPGEPGSKAGIITSETGERHIPSSVRPDGTKRKEIKIRPGYKPPEDVEVYKNRTADAWKTRGSGGVPGATSIESNSASGDSKASNKNAKRREARKKAKASSDDREDEEANGYEQKETDAGLDDLIDLSNGQDWKKPAKSKDEAVPDEDWRQASAALELNAAAEKDKQARNLKKKLRQAKELSEKKAKGESLLPEQFEKVIKINELIRQLDHLGFDAEGEPKGP
ncbi:hypothetical protein MMC09_003970 [Bachmanniomyces sp. S44760]|nr:hypothetical protein [Bachmanniomyces sp. S44760]